MRVSLVALIASAAVVAADPQAEIPAFLRGAKSRFTARGDGFAETTIVSSTCDSFAMQRFAECGALTDANACNSHRSSTNGTGVNPCKWSGPFTVYDYVSCTNDGPNGACYCGRDEDETPSYCAPNDIDCSLVLDTTLGGSKCYTTEIVARNGDGTSLAFNPPVPGATPTATPGPDSGECDINELVKYAQQCSHATSSAQCSQVSGCAWCEMSYPDAASCNNVNGQCDDCEMASEGVCTTTMLECSYRTSVNEGSSGDGPFCFDMEVDFRRGSCPNLSFEGPGVRNGTGPTPTVPPTPSAAPGEPECTQEQLIDALTGCSADNEDSCSAKSGCTWCSLPSLDCELEGNRCGCNVGSEGFCVKTAAQACRYRAENEIDGVVCGEIDVAFMAGKCPSVKFWTAGSVHPTPGPVARERKSKVSSLRKFLR